MGRQAAGVNAIRLQQGDAVAGVDVVSDPELELLVVTRKAYGKRTPLREYPQQGRYGLGVRTLARNEKTGPVIDARVVRPTDHLTLITAGGKALRTAVENISLIGRNTQGVRIMRIPKDDFIASIALHDEARRVEREEALAAETHDLEAQAAAYYARLEADRVAQIEIDDDEDEPEYPDEFMDDQGLED
jgi:DNA gyrase subunit A